MTDTELNTNRKLRARVAEQHQLVIDLADELLAVGKELAALKAGQGEPVNKQVADVVFAALKTVGRFITPQDEYMVKEAVRLMKPLYTQGCATSCLQAPTIPAGWDEERIDIIGQNGNDGIHCLGEHYGEDRN